MQFDLFALVADRLEAETDLDRLEARGTLRIALEKSGVDPRNLSRAELVAVFENIMSDELARRGVSSAAEVCDIVLKSLPSDLPPAPEGSATSRDEIMRRLASS
jgi:hypothetical protein